ncbi:MAG: hypothetical protein H6779_03250 [Candidatus Nomurabacteria bacterium]|nr:hypothetical protein [Candidatus Nomurabacteria bacterium]USN87407.1 MAG: hypothetical protein H6779_03250 [Candidatus Nomurabacteria bacterium]
MSFSQGLVEQYQRYMERRCGVCITHEQAQLHLASLARLYTAISFSQDSGGGRVRLSPHPHPEAG